MGTRTCSSLSKGAVHPKAAVDRYTKSAYRDTATSPAIDCVIYDNRLPGRRGSQSGKPNAMMLEFTATAMYCLPSTVKVIGEECQRAPSGKCQSGCPVLASTAVKAPSSLPKNTKPPAVAIRPPQASPAPTCSYSQAIFPVCGSIARRYFRGCSEMTGRAAPP